MNAPLSIRPDFEPGRLWSLWDMITFTLEGTFRFFDMLRQEERVAEQRAFLSSRYLGSRPTLLESVGTGIEPEVSQGDRERIRCLLDYGVKRTEAQELEATYARLERCGDALRSPVLTYSELSRELRAIREAAEDELKYRYFYYYPREKSKMLLQFESDWSQSNKAFGRAKDDARAAVDCYALNQPTAAVFHCMRVLEHGLKALAASVGLTFDVQQWKNIIDEIEREIEKIRNNGIPGIGKAAKDDRLQFLSEAAKEFFYFKDGWRNYLSHNRATYDEHMALGTLEHTRAFMNHLSSQLSE